MRSLSFISGMNITLALVLPTCLRVSRYRICIAAFEFSYYAASLINLADSTSALAEIILLSAKRRSLAALDNESCKSLLNWISLMKISSISINNKLHLHPIPQHIDRLAFKYPQLSLVFSPIDPEVWIARMYFSI